MGEVWPELVAKSKGDPNLDQAKPHCLTPVNKLSHALIQSG